jgi:hypothetical protein
VTAATPLFSGFDKDGKKIAEYFLSGADKVSLRSQVDGKVALTLPSHLGKRVSCVIRTIRVEQGCRYRLTFRCAVKGPFIFEKNPQVGGLVLMSRNERREIALVSGLPRWHIAFQDAAGKSLRTGTRPFYTFMLYGESSYIDEVKAPEGAKTATIYFSNGNKDSIIDIYDLRFEKVDKPKYLNINGDFAFGGYNYAGWTGNYQSSCWLIPRVKDGKGGWNLVGGIMYGDPIKVKPSEKFKISYKFTNTVKGRKVGRLRIWFYSKKRGVKPLREFVRIATASKGAVVEGEKQFDVPPNTEVMKIYLNGGVYDYVWIRKADGEAEKGGE